MTLRSLFAAAGALAALSACGQSATSAESTVAPQSLMDQVLAMAPEQQPVHAYQQLVAYQQAHPEAAPPCTTVRSVEPRGIIPDDVDPASAYGPFKGGAVYSVQCGALLSRTAYDPKEHWLIAFMPGADAVQVVSCAGAHARDACPTPIPRAH